MQYRNLGRTGLKVSEICLGTMTFGFTTDEDEGKRIVDLAFDAGVNFFDTANTYAQGRSEEILGKALKGRRRDAVVATKFFNPIGPDINDSGMSRRYIVRAVEDSLRRLQMDYVDLLYIHHVDHETPLEEMLRAMDDLVRQGKALYTACSNFEGWRLLEAVWISEVNGWEKFACYQPLYNLVARDIDDEILPICRLKGIGVAVWGPLAGGFLTGKYQPGQRELPGTRSAEKWVFPTRFFAPNADETLAELLAVSEQISRNPAQVALRWVLEQPGITSTIAGARTAEQFRDSLGAAGFRLEGEALERLNAVSRPPDRYPRATESAMAERRAEAVKMPSLGE